MNRAYKVYKIEEGTVIDHIKQGRGVLVAKLLGLTEEKENIVTLGVNLNSEKHGRKDVLKVENKFLKEEEINKISLVSPTATINILKNSKVKKKKKVEIPKQIKKVMECPNHNCITNSQKVETKFKYYKEREEFECHFCERVFNLEKVRIKE